MSDHSIIIDLRFPGFPGFPAFECNAPDGSPCKAKWDCECEAIWDYRVIDGMPAHDSTRGGGKSTLGTRFMSGGSITLAATSKSGTTTKTKP